jgi:hypothetical protein
MLSDTRIRPVCGLRRTGTTLRTDGERHQRFEEQRACYPACNGAGRKVQVLRRQGERSRAPTEAADASASLPSYELRAKVNARLKGSILFTGSLRPLNQNHLAHTELNQSELVCLLFSQGPERLCIFI